MACSGSWRASLRRPRPTTSARLSLAGAKAWTLAISCGFWATSISRWAWPDSVGNWAIRVRSRGTSQATSGNVLNPLVTDSFGRWIITTDFPTLATVGTKVHVYTTRNKAPKGLAGDAWVTAVNTTASTMTLSTGPLCPYQQYTLNGPAKVSLIVPLAVPITVMEFERFVKRDTGRSFFGTRGRRSTASC